MSMNSKRHLLTVAILGGLISMLMSGCDRQPNAVIQTARPSTESFVNVGDYEMHFNAVRSDQLTADIARAYGIERSKNKVLLNISVLNHANKNTVSTDANITVLARNLNNQVKDVPLRRITEGSAIYYIGDADISGTETLVFEINALPAGSSNTITAKLTREFFAN